MIRPDNLLPALYNGGTAQGAPPQAQRARTADADIYSQAMQLEARAQAEGGTVVTHFTYAAGPDGRPYITSVTVTRTAAETINGEKSDNKRNTPVSLSDLEPANLPLSPSSQALAYASNGQDLAEMLALHELQHADASVRTHEGLHFRTASGLASGLPEYDYITGPDGKLYAVAGNVKVRTSATADPEKAARDMTTFHAAATAPGDASAEDMGAARAAHQSATDHYGKALAQRASPQFSSFNFFA